MQQDALAAGAEYWARDYFNQTTIHWMGIAAVLVLGSLTLIVPRKFAVLPFLTMACAIPSAQRIVIFQLDFTLLRLMILFGVARILARREYQGVRLMAPDKLILAWAFVTSFAYVALHRNLSGAIFMSGLFFDALGLYFLARCLVRNLNDVRYLAIGLAILSLPVAAAFVNEKLTGRNFFSVFGGVSEITWVRAGKVRCQGAFDHSILAGCFWSASLPLMVSLWWTGKTGKRLALLGTACGLIVVFMCASSTPLMGLMIGLLSFLLIPLRRNLRLLRWGIVMALIGLHFVREFPVWHLISKIDLVGGSSGYHRYMLIDNCIKRFDEWWLIGTKWTTHWGFGMWDVTNQYVLMGVRGGILGLILYVATISKTFSSVGHLWRFHERSRVRFVISWALGTGLLIHCVQLVAISYFGQINFHWYLSLAVIVSLSESAERSSGRRYSLGSAAIARRRHRATRHESRSERTRSHEPAHGVAGT